jgi:hypothetical protein
VAPGAQRHQFNMASEAEGDALCAALNANCSAIATVQKEADKQKVRKTAFLWSQSYTIN